MLFVFRLFVVGILLGLVVLSAVAMLFVVVIPFVIVLSFLANLWRWSRFCIVLVKIKGSGDIRSWYITWACCIICSRYAIRSRYTICNCVIVSG